MAVSEERHASATFRTGSYDTALCIIPPQHRCQEIDKLRSLYDKDFGKWPPHINLIHPFVAPESLSQAKERIEAHIQTSGEAHSLTVALGGAGIIKYRRNDIVVLQTREDTERALKNLRSELLRALGVKPSFCNFHLTVGQTEDASIAARQFLFNKASLVPVTEFEVGSLAILIHENNGEKGNAASQMRLWDSVQLPGSPHMPNPTIPECWISNIVVNGEFPSSSEESHLSGNRQAQPGATYLFNSESQTWSQCTANLEVGIVQPKLLSISSYNVLIGSEYPPARDRDPLLVKNILAESAIADILVLQEVSDEFLSHLLQVREIQEEYPYASHGPPAQADIGPLPSLRNIVILSTWFFKWEYVPFHRRHKGAVVASFPSIFDKEHTQTESLIVAGMHLTAGLTDGSVAAKKVQLQNVVNHLRRNYSTSPWLLAGDFNLPTSRYTIEGAVKENSISVETSRLLYSTESTLSETGLLDAWAAARVEGLDDTTVSDTDDLFEGEEGATFNPRENPLAAYISGSSQNRPQRYDHVFMRQQGKFALNRFNHFGLPESTRESTSVASDHSGVRAVFKVHFNTDNQNFRSPNILQERVVHHTLAPLELSQTTDLLEALSKRAVFPTTEDEDRYKRAFALIKEVLLGGGDGSSSTSDIPMIVVPVGSYALRIWTPDSDIDSLCIGSISSKTFFQLARQRILKAESKGVRLLRKIQANTGTMLELTVNGINMNLQYCPAANVVQRWSEFANLPATDPMFNLPILSLRKLKPIRDLAYLQRTLPSLASFRLAYHFIKQWANERGIYSAKFGYFGGIHITLMLSWVCKRLAHDIGSVSASDLILSFFRYYVNFDWKNDIVYDASFHKKKPRYQRSAREPMVILGFHAPNSNIAHTATVPGLRVIVSELRHADRRLSTPGMTWKRFFCIENSGTGSILAANNFLRSFESFVKVDIQYWGRALSRGKGLVGWVESRGISLVVDIHKSLPHSFVHIWPSRFAESEANALENYYHGCYLIGLSRGDDKAASVSEEDRSEMESTLRKAFDRFLAQVRENDKYYDDSSSWIGVSLAKPSEVQDLLLDEREWGDYTPDIDSDSDDELELDELEPVNTVQQKLPIRSTRASHDVAVSSNKLRPASDILNRLRWDPNLDPSDYIVGYEDRFLGTKETMLEKWKTEQTDEEFIPQHRILYFKKKSEGGGEVVWERATRIDRVFGSGVGSGQ